MEHTLSGRLSKIGIFSRALEEPGALELILGLLKPRKYDPGAVILSEGEEGEEFYLLHRGRVRILKRTAIGDMYTVMLLDEGSNAFFGEAGLLESERRGATVIAETEVECFVMRRDDFISLGDAHPEIGLYITREIAKIILGRMRNVTKDLVTLFTALVAEVEGESGLGQGRVAP